MRLLLVLALLTGCVTTMDIIHVELCEDACEMHGGLHKLGIKMITGYRCCQCIDGDVIELDERDE